MKSQTNGSKLFGFYFYVFPYGQYSNTSERNSETITYNNKSKIQCYTEDLNLTKGKIKIVINVISPGTHSLRYE
jgi:hypothetical protein